jgi:hypothetical protein
MPDPFFEHPILNSPYECPRRHWELDEQGQPTQQILEQRRRAEFITPIPRPKKQKGQLTQRLLVFNEGAGLSTEEQQYDPTSLINAVRGEVDRWRAWPKSSEWQVTPETARLLQHWRHHSLPSCCASRSSAAPAGLGRPLAAFPITQAYLRGRMTSAKTGDIWRAIPFGMAPRFPWPQEPAANPRWLLSEMHSYVGVAPCRVRRRVIRANNGKRSLAARFRLAA